MELIRKYILDDHQTDRGNLIYELQNLRHLNPKGVIRTNVGGWHSSDLVSNNKFDILTKSIIHVVNNDIFHDDIITGIATSWVIINNKVPQLIKYKFQTMFLKDKLTSAIPNLDSWIMEFTRLDRFRGLSNGL